MPAANKRQDPQPPTPPKNDYWDPSWKPLIPGFENMPPMGWRNPGEGETGFQPLIPALAGIVPFGYYPSQTGSQGFDMGEVRGRDGEPLEMGANVPTNLTEATQIGLTGWGEAMERATADARINIQEQKDWNVQYEAAATAMYGGAQDRYLGTMGRRGERTGGDLTGGVRTGGLVGKMDIAEADLQAGYTSAMGTLEQARLDVQGIPDRLRTDLAQSQGLLDRQLVRAEILVGRDRSEALEAVHLGYANMLSTATGGAHAAQSENNSKINALVQQGQLSGAQAEMMKMQFNMGSNMNIAQSIGGVGAKYAEMEQKTYADFGQMLTSLEQTGIGATAGLQQAGMTTIGAAEVALGNMNVALADSMANVEAQRTTNAIALTEIRVAAEASFSEYELSMLPEMHQPYIASSIAEYNNAFMWQEWMRVTIGAEQAQKMQEIIERAGVLQAIGGAIDFGATLYTVLSPG